MISITCTVWQLEEKHGLLRFLCKGSREWMCSLIIHSQTIREKEVVSYPISPRVKLEDTRCCRGRQVHTCFQCLVFCVFFCICIFLTVWRTHPSAPQGRPDSWQGPLVTVCIFSPNSNYDGKTSQYLSTDQSRAVSCEPVMADTSVDKCRPYALPHPQSGADPVNPAHLVNNTALAIPGRLGEGGKDLVYVDQRNQPFIRVLLSVVWSPQLLVFVTGAAWLMTSEGCSSWGQMSRFHHFPTCVEPKAQVPIRPQWVAQMETLWWCSGPCFTCLWAKWRLSSGGNHWSSFYPPGELSLNQREQESNQKEPCSVRRV